MSEPTNDTIDQLWARGRYFWTGRWPKGYGPQSERRAWMDERLAPRELLAFLCEPETRAAIVNAHAAICFVPDRKDDAATLRALVAKIDEIVDGAALAGPAKEGSGP